MESGSQPINGCLHAAKRLRDQDLPRRQISNIFNHGRIQYSPFQHTHLDLKYIKLICIFNQGLHWCHKIIITYDHSCSACKVIMDVLDTSTFSGAKRYGVFYNLILCTALPEAISDIGEVLYRQPFVVSKNDRFCPAEFIVKLLDYPGLLDSSGLFRQNLFLLSLLNNHLPRKDNCTPLIFVSAGRTITVQLSRKTPTVSDYNKLSQSATQTNCQQLQDQL